MASEKDEKGPLLGAEPDLREFWIEVPGESTSAALDEVMEYGLWANGRHYSVVDSATQGNANQRALLLPVVFAVFLLFGMLPFLDYGMDCSIYTYTTEKVASFMQPAPVAKPQVANMVATTKVPLEVHIMSKCPDARDCLEDLVVPAMANVSDKVDFKMSFIGKTTTEDDGVECMHGATECLGNIIELCAASVYPDPKIYLGFTLCLSRSYQDIPARELIYGCALEHGMDFDALNDCASEDDGGHGMDLLQSSVEHSSDLNVTKSCTIRLNDKVRCIRDGGKWKDCDEGSTVESLIDDINDLYDDSNPKAI
jgi:hypothetical protein